VAAAHPQAAVTLSWPAEALADLDAETDLDRLRRRLRGGEPAPAPAGVAAGVE
jgi:hypothetical protein